MTQEFRVDLSARCCFMVWTFGSGVAVRTVTITPSP
jgi:hypothetical protein